MNVKTTFFLAVMLGALVLFYLAIRPELEAARTAEPVKPAFGEPDVASALLEEPLGNIVKVVCRREGFDEWVFEKVEPEDGARAEWRMTAPLDVKVRAWEVDRFGRQLGGLTYEISHLPGQPGAVSAAAAGLEPPVATVALTDSDGKTATVEIGSPVSKRETYVRLAGSDRIVVGNVDATQLLKDQAFEYRDGQLWTFDTANVTRVQIEDRGETDGPVNYVFVKDGARWMMESPVTARATSKVENMLRSMSRLRAVEWIDDRPEQLGVYGLEPPALTVRATVETVIEPEPAEPEADPETDEAEPAEEPGPQAPEIQIAVYELHLSDRAPIGEDTKTYLRVGDEAMVATVMKSTADAFKPVLSEWRDMSVTAVRAAAATRIEIVTPEGTAVLVKDAGKWTFEVDGEAVEDPEVRTLLQAVGNLKAVSFVDANQADGADFGFDAPRAEIRLTVPGVEDVERITIGGFTEAQSKRLTYVRRNEVASIAKVRAADVEAIVQSPRAYRSRIVTDIHRDRLRRIELSTQRAPGEGRVEVAFEPTDDGWAMSAPVSAEVRAVPFAEFVKVIARLRAKSVAADPGEPSAFGLNDPRVRVVLFYDLVGAAQAGEDAVDPAVEGELEPDEPQHVELQVTEHDGKVYARRSDRAIIYELTRESYDLLLAEYRSGRVLAFEPAGVTAFSIRSGDTSHVFERRDDGWAYQPELDLPLDAKKIENLLLQLGDLETHRFAVHGPVDPADFGLDAPAVRVTVTLEDGVPLGFTVSERRFTADSAQGFYARVDGRDGVFLLDDATMARFAVSLDELEAAH